jgi:hypothetical protein
MVGRRRVRYGAVAAVLGLVGALAPGGGASAAHVARLDVRPVQVPAGGEVTVIGPPGWAPSPVSIRWNAVDGEVLATFQTTTGNNASFGPGTVTVPNVPPGTYELVGTQDAPPAQTALRGVPARARIAVTAPGAAVPEPQGTAPLPALAGFERVGGTPAAAVLAVAAATFAVTLAVGLVGGSAARRRASTAAAA